MDRLEKIEQEVKQQLRKIDAPLDRWDDIIADARSHCKHKYAYHAWLIKTYSNAYPDFVKSAGIKMHWEKENRFEAKPGEGRFEKPKE